MQLRRIRGLPLCSKQMLTVSRSRRWTPMTLMSLAQSKMATERSREVRREIPAGRISIIQALCLKGGLSRWNRAVQQ